MSNIIPVGSVHDDLVAVYSELNENQLFHYYEPNGGIFIAESLNVIERARNMGCVAESFLVEPKFVKDVEAWSHGSLPDGTSFEIPIYVAEQKAMSELVGYHVSRGVLSAMKRPVLPVPETILQDPAAYRIAVLEAVQNPTNVGAIIRSAAALGIDAVLLTEGCSDPLYRRASRVSVGTVFQVPWTYLPKAIRLEEAGSIRWISEYDLPSYLRSFGFRTAAMALSDNSVPIDDPGICREEKLAIILGTESDGLKEETILSSDYVVRIPMSHGVDSLNVAAASAVAFWQLRRR
ncbi:MAG: RNA methyltransferase [Firmicutes bacterium]|nr:RNA methyltransferase [Bacillota bacterium]